MRGFSGFFSSLSIPFTLVVGLAAQSCAPKVSEQVETIRQCDLPADQNKTLLGRWKQVQVPLAFHSGDFTSAEMSAIMDAADVWNKHYGKVQGFPVFDYGNRDSPRLSTTSKVGSLCSYTLVETTGQFKSSVVIYKQSAWPYTEKDAIAITSSCYKAAEPLQSTYMSMIEVNFQYFFAAGLRQPDLKSIFVHELGHLLGLNHSCSAATKAGFPNCSSSSLSQDYYDAVMFPTVFFDSSGVGQSRTQLQVNDQGRANCLYGSTAI